MGDYKGIMPTTGVMIAVVAILVLACIGLCTVGGWIYGLF